MECPQETDFQAPALMGLVPEGMSLVERQIDEQNRGSAWQPWSFGEDGDNILLSAITLGSLGLGLDPLRRSSDPS